MIIFALGSLGIGLLLIRTAFAENPDPRAVIRNFLGQTTAGNESITKGFRIPGLK